MPKEKLFAQARDELFSHINRCGVLSATDDDRTAWMNETVDYIGERYPDLVAPDLQELHQVGIRFCQPAINNVPDAVVAEPVAEAVDETATEEASGETDNSDEQLVASTAGVVAASEVSQDQDGGANAA